MECHHGGAIMTQPTYNLSQILHVKQYQCKEGILRATGVCREELAVLKEDEEVAWGDNTLTP